LALGGKRLLPALQQIYGAWAAIVSCQANLSDVMDLLEQPLLLIHRVAMKGLSAKRIQVSLGDIWKSPNLHVLLTQEEKVVVARCLDFTVSSHGENEKEAIQSLGEVIKEYLLTAIEENAMDMVYDPAQNKYWRMFLVLYLRPHKFMNSTN
jgi:hypothetical protein